MQVLHTEGVEYLQGGEAEEEGKQPIRKTRGIAWNPARAYSTTEGRLSCG